MSTEVVMEKKAGYTPGPWYCYAETPSTDPNWHIVTSEGRQRVIANLHIEPGNAMDEANARLITAAPELLAALESAIESYTDLCGRNGMDAEEFGVVIQARAAIAKTKGGA